MEDKITTEDMIERLGLERKPKFSLHVFMCRFFGHKWKYNFPSIPNKAMCTRCKCKSVLNLKTLEWISVKNFNKEKRTDEQLAWDWV